MTVQKFLSLSIFGFSIFACHVINLNKSNLNKAIIFNKYKGINIREFNDLLVKDTIFIHIDYLDNKSFVIHFINNNIVSFKQLILKKVIDEINENGIEGTSYYYDTKIIEGRYMFKDSLLILYNFYTFKPVNSNSKTHNEALSLNIDTLYFLFQPKTNDLHDVRLLRLMK